MSQTAFLIALPEEVQNAKEILGYPVHYSGVGKLNAAIGAMELARRGFTEIINLGSCGSKKHAVGEIIRIGKSYQDIDCSPICAYGETAFEDNSSFIELDPNEAGTCFTTDYFYHEEYKSKYSPDYMRMIQTCSVFDMELFGIAKVCRSLQIKLTSYKWVSDDGDFSQWAANCEAAFHKVEAIISTIH